MQVEIEKIKVHGRIRKDFGNIEELAQDIKENGLINPPVVTPEFELIAGERRLRACTLLGLTTIDVNVMTVRDYEHQLRLEISENENRKEFTFSERVAWARRLEEVERLKARERMESGASQNSDKGRVDDAVSEQSGLGSRDTFRKAKFIADNAEPELIRQLDEKTISIHAAYQKLKERAEAAEQRAQQAEAARQLAVNEHSKQQEKLLAQIGELKKRKGRSPEDDAMLKQLLDENVALNNAMATMQDEFAERYSTLEKKNHDLRKMKESLNKTTAYIISDLSAALMYFRPIRDQKEAIEVAEQFWRELDETIAKHRERWQEMMENPLIEVNEDAGRVAIGRPAIVIDADSEA